MGSKISNTEWGLVIGALLAIDVFQFILDMFVIGVVANRFIDMGVGMILPFYLKIRGVKLDKKKIGGMVGAFFLEMVPGLDALPLWSLDGVMNMVWDKADKKIHQATASVPGSKFAIRTIEQRRSLGPNTLDMQDNRRTTQDIRALRNSGGDADQFKKAA